MNRQKFSLIAHTDHTFANPLGEDKIDRLLSLLDLPQGSRALDVGCGNAELLIRLIERYGVVGVGVDPNEAVIEQARARAAGRISPDRLELHALPIEEFAGAPGAFDAALCIGATHAYGGYEQTLAALPKLVRPGGQILIGEGFWRRDPDPAYLDLLDAQPDEFTTHAGNVARAVAARLTPLYSAVSSEDDWDHYEGLYCRAVERYVAAHPDDPDAPAFRDRIRRWRDGYLQWGRDTLGFGLYLFRT